MAQKTKQSTAGTSFYNVTFKASVNQLKKAFGEPEYECNDGSDKSNFDWALETDNKKVFTIYDWKKYRQIGLDEKIEWNIGAKDRATSIEAKREILYKI